MLDFKELQLDYNLPKSKPSFLFGKANKNISPYKLMRVVEYTKNVVQSNLYPISITQPVDFKQISEKVRIGHEFES